MALVLSNVDYKVDNQVYLDNINLSFEPGSFNVLLGRTLAGKTSLMRIIAGLDKPTKGKISVDGLDVGGLSVQKRNVSMVYQQFINYPNMTVAQNIASPLAVAGFSPAEIERRVQETAELLHIQDFLQRYPLELSGGQQQRCAMARALIKEADIILFDEPLVNLDYKLREALRAELKALFESRDCIAIYATTEAQEALALGGYTTLLHQGRVLQSGPAQQQYAQPVNLHAADLYHEPPLNRFNASIRSGTITLQTQNYPIGNTQLPDGDYQFGIRADHIKLESGEGNEICLHGSVDLAEISASETYLHVSINEGDEATAEPLSWVVHLQGIQSMHTQTPIKLYFPIEKLFIFGLDGAALKWPQSRAVVETAVERVVD